MIFNRGAVGLEKACADAAELFKQFKQSDLRTHGNQVGQDDYRDVGNKLIIE